MKIYTTITKKCGNRITYVILTLKRNTRDKIVFQRISMNIDQAKYEEFPLAKDRREAKIKMEKVQIDQMVLEYKVKEFEKILKQKQRIAWLRMRAKIVLLARAVLNYTKLVETLKDLDRNIEKRKEELNTIETEVSRHDFSHILKIFNFPW